jgi:hypothetical protein
MCGRDIEFGHICRYTNTFCFIGAYMMAANSISDDENKMNVL